MVDHKWNGTMSLNSDGVWDAEAFWTGENFGTAF